MWKKRLRRRQLSHPHPSATVIYADPCCSNMFCPIFSRVALTDCQPQWKQTAAGQERLQEAICFYKVDMGRAGLFCWKWLSSSLSPWPWALCCLRAREGGWERREGWLRHGCTGSQNTRRFTGGRCNSAFTRLTSSSRRCGRFSSPPWKIPPLSYTRVYHKHTPHFGPIGGASGFLSSRHQQCKHDLTSPHKARL